MDFPLQKNTGCLVLGQNFSKETWSHLIISWTKSTFSVSAMGLSVNNLANRCQKYKLYLLSGVSFMHVSFSVSVIRPRLCGIT